MTYRELLKKKLEEMNDSCHDEYAARNYNGNTRDYRVAIHNCTGYKYISNLYVIGMSSIPLEALTEDECKSLLETGYSYFEDD